MGTASEVTGQQLVDGARRRCDQVESDFRDPEAWYALVSAAWAKVYRRVCRAGGDHSLDSRVITTESGTEAYDLPYDCWLIKGVEVTISGKTRTLDRFSWDRRNRYGDTEAWTTSRPIAYRERGQQIIFQPIPQGVYSVRIWFFPPPERISGGSVLDGIAGFEEAVMVAAACAAATEQGDMELAAKLAADEAAALAEVESMVTPRDVGGIEYAVDVYDRADEWDDS